MQMSLLQRNGTDIKATGNSVTDQTTVCKCPFSKGMGQILKATGNSITDQTAVWYLKYSDAGVGGRAANSRDSMKEEVEKTATSFL